MLCNFNVINDTIDLRLGVVPISSKLEKLDNRRVVVVLLSRAHEPFRMVADGIFCVLVDPL